jgi:hypothetical protein
MEPVTLTPTSMAPSLGEKVGMRGLPKVERWSEKT